MYRNDMYDYLKEHAYISKNKKSNYQFELSEERAECIANKFNSLVIDLYQNQWLGRIQDLEQENQELKKQLHKSSLEIQHLIEQDIDCPSNCDKLRRMKEQQKEFIEWLEAKIKNYELPLTDENKKALGYTLPMKGIYKEILSKYKEIIGGKHE